MITAVVRGHREQSFGIASGHLLARCGSLFRPLRMLANANMYSRQQHACRIRRCAPGKFDEAAGEEGQAQRPARRLERRRSSRVRAERLRVRPRQDGAHHGGFPR